MEEPKIKLRNLKLIREFRKGAYVISDGANYSLENSSIRARSNTLRKLIENGVLVDTFHEPNSFDERKYILNQNFDLEQELLNIKNLSKKLR